MEEALARADGDKYGKVRPKEVCMLLDFFTGEYAAKSLWDGADLFECRGSKRHTSYRVETLLASAWNNSS